MKNIKSEMFLLAIAAKSYFQEHLKTKLIYFTIFGYFCRFEIDTHLPIYTFVDLFSKDFFPFIEH